jgi:hypothetical protein
MEQMKEEIRRAAITLCRDFLADEQEWAVNRMARVISEVVVKSVAEEQERCAKIAESYGMEGAPIADEIRDPS